MTTFENSGVEHQRRGIEAAKMKQHEKSGLSSSGSGEHHEAKKSGM